MPIRINLKELFSSDSQELIADKLNFNFNKLLELGIGEIGPKGFPGIQGSAGPMGIVGPSGLRGNTWFVDSLTPPSIIPDPNDPEYLLEGDFYLNSQTFAVYQWNGTQWLPIFDLTSIINGYLSNSPSPFIRGLGTGSPNDNRYILFNNRYDSTYPDNNAGSSNNSSNDILFLNNFNEDNITISDLDFPTGTKNQYTALEKIFVNHSSGSTGRFHLELGSLYDANAAIPSSTPDYKLSRLNENFKMRFIRRDGSIHSLLDHYNVSLFSMDSFELNPTGQITNGVFQFQSSRYLGASPLSSTSSFSYIGSRYGFDEIVGSGSGTVLVDGLLFENRTGPNLYGAIGIALRHDINIKNSYTYFPENTGYVTNIPSSQSYFMLDGYESTDGVYINQKTLQDGGNIVQLGTTLPRVTETVNSEYATYTDFNKYAYHTGIAYSGNNIYTFSGNFDIDFLNALETTYGYLNKFNISNPNYPISEMPGAFSKVSGFTDTGIVPTLTCDETYSNTNIPIGPGASDLAIVGDYAYAVNTHNIRLTNNVSGYGSECFLTQFQILKLNSINTVAPKRISRLGYLSKKGSTSLSNWPEELNSAFRVKIKGKHAIVATNALHNAFASPTELGAVTGSGAVPNQNYDGFITAIDVTDPYDPKIVASTTNTKTLSGSVVRSAMLDIVVIGNTVVTLTWEQQIVNSGNATVRVHTDFFDISQLDSATPSISWIGQSTDNFTQSSINASTYSTVIKRGAITANEKYIYAAYGNEIKIYSLTDFTTTGNISLGTCKKNYTLISSFILQDDVSLLDPITNLPPPINIGHVHAGIRDIKTLGNSAYVLATEYNPVTFELESYLYKLDISGVGYSISTVPSQIYRKKLDYIGSKLEIIGKHIYIAIHGDSLSSDSNQSSLISVDFDGLYTGGAHIESLRSDNIISSGNIESGKDIISHGNISSGSEIHANGSVSTGGTFIGIGAVPIGGIIPFAGSSAPSGWLICDGSAIPQSDYPELYSIIGSAYGSSGANFNIPDLRQRIPLGYDSTTSSTPTSSPSVGELNYAELGNTGGNNEISPILPIHTHEYDDYTFGSGSNHIWINQTINPGADGTKLKFSANEIPETYPTGVDPTVSKLDNRMKYLVLNYIIYSGK